MSSHRQPKPVTYWSDRLEELQKSPVRTDEEKIAVEALAELVRVHTVTQDLVDTWVGYSNTVGIGGASSAPDIRARAFELEMSVLKGVEFD